MEKVIELHDVTMPNLWRHFRVDDLRACDGVYGKKRGRRSKGVTLWCHGEVKEAISRKAKTRCCVGIVLRRIGTGMKHED